MEFVVASDELRTKLEIARRFTGKSTMDITESIKLYIPEKHDVLVIEASDYNKACRIRVKNVDIKSRGVVVVDGERLQRIVSSFGGVDLHFRTTGQLMIKSQSGELFKLVLLNPLEFPSIPGIPGSEKTFTIEAKDLVDICERLEFATDTSLARKGISKPFAELLYFRNQIVFATDAFKLAAIALPNFSAGGMDLPVATLPLLRLLDGEVHITPEGTNTYLQSGDFFYFLRAPDTKAPAAEQIIRSYNNPKVIYAFQSEELNQLRINLKRLAIIDQNVSVIFKRNKILMGSFSSVGEHICEVNVLAKEFLEESAAAYNASFLLGALKRTETPILASFGKRSPVKITEGNYACLVQATAQHHIEKLERYDEEGGAI